MKNLMFLFIAAAFLLTGCVNFEGTDLSVWAKGKWIVFWAPLLGGIAFITMAYFASKSGSTKQLGNNTGRNENAGNVSIFQQGKFFIGAAMLIAAIVFYFMINAEK